MKSHASHLGKRVILEVHTRSKEHQAEQENLKLAV